MTFKSHIWLVFLLCSAFAKAQLQSSQWFFGENAGTDFRSGTATATATSVMQTGEGCATISDKSGNLLFYTDGSTVYNRNHQVMLNGTGLKGNSSSTSSAVVVPYPENENQFYIFTVDTDDLVYRNAEGMHYSIVDMRLDNGSGAVIQSSKNTLVLARTSEKLTAVENREDDGYWIVTQFEGTFYSYELTSNGLSLDPVLSQVDPFIELVDYFITNVDVAAMRGYIKINSTGDKLAAAHFSNNSLSDFNSVISVLDARSRAYTAGGELYLYDFDNATGIVSNPNALMTKQDQGSFYGVEFSPDGRLLYATVDYLQPSTIRIFDFIGGEIAQFDLNAADIPNSKKTIYQDTNPIFRGALQLGVDGNIYHARINQPALSVIANPNDLSVPVSYGYNQLPLAPGTISVYGLPIFVQSFFQEFQIVAEDVCDGKAVEYGLDTSTEDFEVVWNFGDPSLLNDNVSNAREGLVTYTQPGTYTITATITTIFQQIVLEQEVTVFEQVKVNDFPSELTTCDLGENRTFFNLSNLPSSINLQPDQQVVIYTTNEDATAQTNPIDVTVPFPVNTTETSLFVRIDNANCFKILEIILLIERCPIEVFNALSPNGDQSNDTWVIPNLREIYDRFEISIFNRYGRLVWEGDAATSDWDGTSNVINSSQLLPAGTYYYVINLFDPEVSNPAGYIYLNY